MEFGEIIKFCEIKLKVHRFFSCRVVCEFKPKHHLNTKPKQKKNIEKKFKFPRKNLFTDSTEKKHGMSVYCILSVEKNPVLFTQCMIQRDRQVWFAIQLFLRTPKIVIIYLYKRRKHSVWIGNWSRSFGHIHIHTHIELNTREKKSFNFLVKY